MKGHWYLIERLRGAGLSHTQACKVLQLLFSAISEAVRNGEEVRIRGFGTFKPTVLRGRTIKCFGREVQVPDRLTIRFRSRLKW